MTVSAERLPWGVKLAYGLGELGPAMAGSTLIFFLMIFLTDVAGLSPALAGLVLLVAKVWDAVNDPLIGWLTDRTRSRWGRRLPWMVAGAGPFAVFFWLHWVTPFEAGEGTRQGALFAYYLCVALLMNTFYTAVSLPYASLTPELTHDYDERTRLVGWRQAFSLAGSVGGLAAGSVVFALVEGGARRQYAVFAGVIAAVILGGVAGCVAGIWRTALRRDRERRELGGDGGRVAAMPARRQLGLVLRNRPYLIVCGLYLCSWLAVQFTATILPYYARNCLGLGEADFYNIALAVQMTALALLPVWGWLATRLGKKAVYFAGMALWIAAQGGLLFHGPGAMGWTYALAVMAGAGVSVAYLIPFAMLPDVIELDELETGERREGVYYGLVVFLQKTGLAAAQFVAGVVLELAGYQAGAEGGPPPEQPESALAAIRFAIGPLPGLALVAGLVFAGLFPIDRRRHEEVRRLLRERRGGAA